MNTEKHNDDRPEGTPDAIYSPELAADARIGAETHGATVSRTTFLASSGALGAGIAVATGLAWPSNSATSARSSVELADSAAHLVGCAPPPARWSRSPLHMLSAMQPGHGFSSFGGGTISDDRRTYALGTQSMRVVSSGNGDTWGSSGRVVLGRAGFEPFDMTQYSLRLWLWIDDMNHIGGLWLRIGHDVATSYFLKALAVRPAYDNYLVSGKWCQLTVDLQQAVEIGTPNKRSCSAIALVLAHDGAGKVSARFNGVALVPKPVDIYPHGVVSFTFDDGYVEQFEHAKPKLDQYGYGATAYIIQDLIGKYPGK